VSKIEGYFKKTFLSSTHLIKIIKENQVILSRKNDTKKRPFGSKLTEKPETLYFK